MAAMSSDTTYEIFSWNNWKEPRKSQSPSLKILYVNASSSTRRLIENLQSYIDGILQTVHLVVITEAWTKAEANDYRALKSEDFDLVTCDRIGQRGGGVAVYVRKGIRCSYEAAYRHGNSYLWVTLEDLKLNVGVVNYPSRSSWKSFLEDYKLQLETQQQKGHRAIVLGDFNTDILSMDPSPQTAGSDGEKESKVIENVEENEILDEINAFNNYDIDFLSKLRCLEHRILGQTSEVYAELLNGADIELLNSIRRTYARELIEAAKKHAAGSSSWFKIKRSPKLSNNEMTSLNDAKTIYVQTLKTTKRRINQKLLSKYKDILEQTGFRILNHTGEEYYTREARDKYKTKSIIDHVCTNLTEDTEKTTYHLALIDKPMAILPDIREFYFEIRDKKLQSMWRCKRCPSDEIIENDLELNKHRQKHPGLKPDEKLFQSILDKFTYI